MASVHIGIGHDDHLVVTQLGEVERLAVLLRADGHAECSVDVPDFLAFEHPVVHRLLHIEDLSPERKDGLSHAVTALLCRTACGVSLDKEKLAFLRVTLRAVSQFSRHSRP